MAVELHDGDRLVRPCNRSCVQAQATKKGDLPISSGLGQCKAIFQEIYCASHLFLSRMGEQVRNGHFNLHSICDPTRVRQHDPRSRLVVRGSVLHTDISSLLGHLL